MTNKSINDKWLDAQSHPEKYTDEELDDMLFSQADLGLLKRALAYDEAKNEAMLKETSFDEDSSCICWLADVVMRFLCSLSCYQPICCE